MSVVCLGWFGGLRLYGGVVLSGYLGRCSGNSQGCALRVAPWEQAHVGGRRDVGLAFLAR